MARWRGMTWFVLAFVGALGSAACERDAPALPESAEALALYQEDYPAVSAAELRGNLVEVTVEQPAEQLQRGGSLWARVGPYIYLFSPSTRRLFVDYPDVAAVRVVTRAPGGAEVARATLVRDSMNDLVWRRSLNILGHALQQGTERPSLLVDLVDWGERKTEYAYSPEYVPE